MSDPLPNRVTKRASRRIANRAERRTQSAVGESAAPSAERSAPPCAGCALRNLVRAKNIIRRIMALHCKMGINDDVKAMLEQMLGHYVGMVVQKMWSKFELDVPKFMAETGLAIDQYEPLLSAALLCGDDEVVDMLLSQKIVPKPYHLQYTLGYPFGGRSLRLMQKCFSVIALTQANVNVALNVAMQNFYKYQENPGCAQIVEFLISKLPAGAFSIADVSRHMSFEVLYVPPCCVHKLKVLGAISPDLYFRRIAGRPSEELFLELVDEPRWSLDPIGFWQYGWLRAFVDKFPNTILVSVAQKMKEMPDNVREILLTSIRQRWSGFVATSR